MFLKITGLGQEYCFKIKENMFKDDKDNSQKFANALIKKYSKYFEYCKLDIIQSKGKLIINSDSQMLELNDLHFESDFCAINGYILENDYLEAIKDTFNKRLQTINNILYADYSKYYFNMHKLLDCGVITVDIENGLLLNEVKCQKITTKTSENFSFSKDISISKKTMDLFSGKKVSVAQNNTRSYLKAEHKNFNVYFLANL